MADEQPKRERYDTTYLVSQIQDEHKRTKQIGMAIGGVLVLAILYFLFIHKPAPDALEGGAAHPPPSASAIVPSAAPIPVPK